MAGQKIALTALVFLVWTFQATADEAKGELSSAASPAPPSWTFWGTATEEYRGRFVVAPEGQISPGALSPFAEKDHDLRLWLEFGASDPRQHFSTQLSLALWSDLNGFAGSDPTTLGSIYDYGHPQEPVWLDVYSLWAEYRTSGFLQLARLGRQQTEHGPAVAFDGASVVLALAWPWLEGFAFGGRTVHFFEVGNDLFEDWLASAGLAMKFSPRYRLELDYRLAIEDITERDGQTRQGVVDHTYGIAGRVQPADWLRLYGEFRMLGTTPARAGLRSRYIFDAIGLEFSANIHVQPSTLRQISESEEVLFAILGESLPHMRWTVEAAKSISISSAEMILRLGWNGRQLLEGEPGPFNRNFGRFYLTGELRDAGVKGLYLSITGDGQYLNLDDDPARQWRFSLGGALGYEVEALFLEAGTYYQRYRINYYILAEEIEEVRTVFARAELKLWSWLRLFARYDFDYADRFLHTVAVGLSQSY